MSITVTIPADAVPVVRKALFCLMGDGAEAISRPLPRVEHELHPEWFAEGRLQLERVFVLLDLIGWADSEHQHDVAVYVGAHGETLRDAADGYLPVLEDRLKEADIDDAQRAEEGQPPCKQQMINNVAALREVARSPRRTSGTRPADGITSPACRARRRTDPSAGREEQPLKQPARVRC